jgi:hypothetical protein
MYGRIKLGEGKEPHWILKYSGSYTTNYLIFFNLIWGIIEFEIHKPLRADLIGWPM